MTTSFQPTKKNQTPSANSSPFKRYGITLALLILLSSTTLLLSGCSEYVSPYNFDNLKNEQGRFSHYEEGNLVSQTAVDVSDLQGKIDWERVSEDGIDFAMIRLGRRGYTEGNIYLDNYYYENVSVVQSEGMPFGVYFFSQAITEDEAIEEANFVIKHLSGSGISYPVVFDHEPVESADGRANNLSKNELTHITKAFCQKIEDAGYTPMIYGNAFDMERLNLNDLKGIDVWYAEYESSQPTGQFDFAMWQYSSTANVSGINTQADLSILFKPLDSARSQ